MKQGDSFLEKLQPLDDIPQLQPFLGMKEFVYIGIIT
jgi:hypothetical protein